jgi:hypothetical protein
MTEFLIYTIIADFSAREFVFIFSTVGPSLLDAMCMLQSSSKNTVNLQGGIDGLKRAGIIL